MRIRLYRFQLGLFGLDWSVRLRRWSEAWRRFCQTRPPPNPPLYGNPN